MHGKHGGHSGHGGGGDRSSARQQSPHQH
ncbi:hypothetical protein HNQ75_003860 [Rhizobium flavum]|nr:hypothetical protein [Pseudorhizobium flavum]